MDIIFHGVRGSTPVPLSNFQKYGGNTTCIEIRHPSFQIILDAGTGFQNVEILGDRPTFLLFSHFHYDHLQGLPFCPGLFDPTRSILISSALVTKQDLRETLGQAFKPSYFPIPLFVYLLCLFQTNEFFLPSQLTFYFLNRAFHHLL